MRKKPATRSESRKSVSKPAKINQQQNISSQANRTAPQLQPSGPGSKSLSPDALLQMQRVSGNQSVMRQLTGLSESDTSEVTPNVQREGPDEDYGQIRGPVRITITLGPPSSFEELVTINSLDDLATAYSELGSAMFFADDDFMPDGRDNPYYEAWDDLEDEIDDTTQVYVEQGKIHTDPPDKEEIKDLRAKIKQVRKLGKKGQAAYNKKQTKYQLQLGRARTKTDAGVKAAKKALRMQFFGGDANTDSAFLWSMVDHLFTFSGTLADSMKLPYYQALAAGTLIPGAVTVANVVLNWAQDSAATAGSALDGLNDLNNAVSIAGALNSFFINPGYIVTAYIGPMLGAITKMLGKLQMQLIETNDDSADALGTPFYLGAEPGGRDMWDYMVTAMRASRATGIPAPTGNVYSYFDKFSDRLDSFNKAQYKGEEKSYDAGERRFPPSHRADVPTESSWLVFSQLDASEFPGWMMKNRDLVWTLLYGARDPKRAKLTTE